MVMQQSRFTALTPALVEKIGKKPRVIYMTPQGQTFNQSIAEDLAKEEDLVFLCGRLCKAWMSVSRDDRYRLSLRRRLCPYGR